VDVARAKAKAHYHGNKDRHRNTRLLRKYGISLVEYDALFVAQGAVGLLAQTEVNHVSLALKLPLPEAGLLDVLAELPESPCLRSFTFSWPLRLLRRVQEADEEPSCVPAVSADFLHRLLGECPLGRHLSHLGSSWPFDAAQAALIRRLGVEPADARHRLWMHALPAACFRARHGG
jgi:hypothetical protein